ncbi:hypothetical protein QWZ08_20100 [Ferruginibacter paludis]|uniref:hypothetical protein n=1 Tax=Ferruginibacter paludis TaxID=1310417 RepID=UPI0025B39031|nr:hypothetical protein [Ferruginibacter paludis]MDN3657966.1 hypothetical protein [Ferruginibacter paludis]
MEDKSIIESIQLKIDELEQKPDVLLYKSLVNALGALKGAYNINDKKQANALVTPGNTVPIGEPGGISNKMKVASILKEAGHFLHMREIVERAIKKEPNEDEKVVTKRTQQAVYSLKSDKVIVSYQVGEGNLNIFWGSKAWVDSEGSIKKEHTYNENQLSGRMKESIEI